MTKPTVFLIEGKRDEPVERLDTIAQTLFKEIGPTGRMNKSVAIKVHVGEIGYDGTDIDSHMKPEWVKAFADIARGKGAKRIVATDSTPTYVFGKRSTVEGHIEVAQAHGFTSERMGIPFSVADENGNTVVPNKRLGGIQIPNLFSNFGSSGGYAIVLSHFTGHEMYTFGGALKNMGMGFVGKDTKAGIHHFKAIVDQAKCLGEECGICVEACTHDAVSYVEKTGEPDKKVAYVAQEDCYGCMGCLRDCGSGAMGLNFGGLGDIATAEGKKAIGDYVTDSLIIAAKEVTEVFDEGHMLFVTDMTSMTGYCDCDSPVKQEHGVISLANDIGYLASTDPVALDKACIDLVQQQISADQWHAKCSVGKPTYFAEALSQQINKAVELGMGSKEYNLRRVA